MKFTLVTEVAHPRDLVFEVQRDLLPKVVAYIPNVDSIERVYREEIGTEVHVRNEWTGSSNEIPALVRPFVKAEWTTWSDEAVWDLAEFQARWQTHLRIFPGAIISRGTTSFEEEGDETLITIHGEFTVDPSKITGIPTGLTRRAAPSIEKFVVGALEPNMRGTFEAVERYIDENY